MNLFSHRWQINHVIFQSKSQIFRDTQPDKLTVCVLQDGTDKIGQVINAAAKRRLTLNPQIPSHFSMINSWNNAI